MSEAQKAAGRIFAIILGSMTALIALAFGLVLALMLFRMSFKFFQIAALLLIAVVTYWFARTSYRLLFNRRRNNGGLFSSAELRIWCQFFGVAAIMQSAFGIYNGELVTVVAGAVMAFAMLLGLRLAAARASCEQQP